MAEKGAPLGAPTAVKESRPSWHKTMLYSGGAEALCFQPEEARRVEGGSGWRSGEGGAKERKKGCSAYGKHHRARCCEYGAERKDWRPRRMGSPRGNYAGKNATDEAAERRLWVCRVGTEVEEVGWVWEVEKERR